MERVQLSAREYCAACVQKGRGAPARVSLHGWMYSIMAKTSFWNLVPLILPCHMALLALNIRVAPRSPGAALHVSHHAHVNTQIVGALFVCLFVCLFNHGTPVVLWWTSPY